MSCLETEKMRRISRIILAFEDIFRNFNFMTDWRCLEGDFHVLSEDQIDRDRVVMADWFRVMYHPIYRFYPEYSTAERVGPKAGADIQRRLQAGLKMHCLCDLAVFVLLELVEWFISASKLEP